MNSMDADRNALVGPFLTRHDVRTVAGVSLEELDGTVIRVDGAFALEPVYPAFQFAGSHVRGDVSTVSTRLLERLAPIEACGWFTAPNPVLGGRTPLQWLDDGGSVDTACRAIDSIAA